MKPSRIHLFTCFTLPTHIKFLTDITSNRIPRNVFGPLRTLKGPIELQALLYQLTSHSQLTLLPTGYPETRFAPLLYLHHFTNSHHILNSHYFPVDTQKRVWTFMKPSRTPCFTCITLPTHITFSTGITSHRIHRNAFGPLSLLALLYQLTTLSQLTLLHSGYPETRLDLHGAFEDPFLYLHHFTNSHHILNLHYCPSDTRKRV